MKTLVFWSLGWKGPGQLKDGRKDVSVARLVRGVMGG
jgi:hypothetical protein